MTEITFGPVPSRRLGRSLGINNIPPKHCSYSCLYCQVGVTQCQEIAPKTFYRPEVIFAQVSERIEAVRAQGETVDYLSFVPDGEPTLDRHLSETIEALRPLNLPIAVISNASLIWRPEVRQALERADWVSLKVDSVDEMVWQSINQPHADLQLAAILEGIRIFARTFGGKLVSETMLLAGINDQPEQLKKLAGFFQEIGFACHYLSIPHRPPAISSTHIPSEASVTLAYQALKELGLNVELLTGYEGDAFAVSGNLRQDILATTAVHPLRESAIRALVTRSGGDFSLVEALVSSGELKTVAYSGEIFYVRYLMLSDA